MLDEAPHTLSVCTKVPLEHDASGKPVKGTGGESWGDHAECFCHDNSQMQQVSVNGQLWAYSYHVVYEGEPIALGTKVRCTDKATGEKVGEGTVKKVARCHSFEFKGRTDLWLE